MTPSIWSALIIFVVAPLTLAGSVIAIVLLTTSRSRPSAGEDQPAPEPECEKEDEGDVRREGEDERGADIEARDLPGRASDADSEME